MDMRNATKRYSVIKSVWPRKDSKYEMTIDWRAEVFELGAALELEVGDLS